MIFIPAEPGERGETAVKRRWAALICCAALFLQLAIPAAAAETVCFTAINETVLELDDATMPFWSGGYLYAPSTVFRDLGIGHSKNLMKGIVMMYAQSQHLIFDLNAGTVADNKGESHYPPAIRRGSVVFLPVALMAETFGLHYSTPQRVNHGYLVRLTNSAAMLNDDTFYDAVSSVLEERYSNYTKSRTPASEEVTPVQPEEPEPEEPVSGKRIYLSMALPGTSGQAVLDALAAYGVQAAFYLTPEEMQSSGDLMRRMSAAGHSVGILVDGSRTDLTAAQQAAQGNEALWKAVACKTRLLRLKNGTEQQRESLEELGYALFSPDLDRSGYGLKSASGAKALLDRVSARRGTVSVWLGKNVNAAGLRSFLREAREAEDRCLPVTETAS